MDFLERVKGAMGGLESFISKVPGYKGYKEKELRREADKLLRDHLVRQFEEQQRKLNDQKLQLFSSGLIELVDELIWRHGSEKNSGTGVNQWIFIGLHRQMQHHIESFRMSNPGNSFIMSAVGEYGKCQDSVKIKEFLGHIFVIADIINNNGNFG